MSLSRWASNISLLALILFSVQLQDAFDLTTLYAAHERDGLEERLQTLNSTSLLNRIFIPAYFLIVLVLFIKNKSSQRSFFRSPGVLLWLFLLCELMLLSIFVSEYTNITVRRSLFQILLVTAVVFNVYLIRNTDEICRVVATGMAFMVLADLAYYFISFNPSDESLLFKGFHTDKNTAGHLLALASMSFLYQCMRANEKGVSRMLYFGMLLVSVYLCFLAQSKTSFGILFLFPFFYLLVYRNRLLRLSTAMFLFVSTVCLSVYLMLVTVDPEFLTGRGQVWSFLQAFLWENAYFGYGYASFWSVGDNANNLVYGESFLMSINTAHNGYFDMVLSFGLVGTVLILGFFALMIVRLVNAEPNFLFWYIYFAFLVGNMTETFWFYYAHPIWVSMIVITVATYKSAVSGRREYRYKNRKQHRFSHRKHMLTN